MRRSVAFHLKILADGNFGIRGGRRRLAFDRGYEAAGKIPYRTPSVLLRGLYGFGDRTDFETVRKQCKDASFSRTGYAEGTITGGLGLWLSRKAIKEHLIR